MFASVGSCIVYTDSSCVVAAAVGHTLLPYCLQDLWMQSPFATPVGGYQPTEPVRAQHYFVGDPCKKTDFGCTPSNTGPWPAYHSFLWGRQAAEDQCPDFGVHREHFHLVSGKVCCVHTPWNSLWRLLMSSLSRPLGTAVAPMIHSLCAGSGMTPLWTDSLLTLCVRIYFAA